MRGQSLTERDATDRYKWSKASVCVEQSCVTCLSGCKSTVSSWTCSGSEVFKLSISEAKSARGTPGSFNFCSFSKRSCSCNYACRFRLFDLSARPSWASFCSLRLTNLLWPKLRVRTQSILCRSHKGAAVPEWKCWSQTLLLFKIIPLAPPHFLEHPTIRHIGIWGGETGKNRDLIHVLVTSTRPPYWYLEHQHGGRKSQVVPAVTRVQAKKSDLYTFYCVISNEQQWAIKLFQIWWEGNKSWLFVGKWQGDGISFSKYLALKTHVFHCSEVLIGVINGIIVCSKF